MNEISGERAERGRRFADSSRFMKLIGQIKRGLETPLTDRIGSSVVVVVQLQIKQLLSRSGASATTPEVKPGDGEAVDVKRHRDVVQ